MLSATDAGEGKVRKSENGDQQRNGRSGMPERKLDCLSQKFTGAFQAFDVCPSQLSEFRVAAGRPVPDLDWPTPGFPAVERRSGRAACRARGYPDFWK